MAIPNGYRLLTSQDVGKVFGTDLELEVYIDTSISIDSIRTSFSIMNFDEDINLTNFLVFRRESNSDGDEYYYAYIKDSSNTYIINYNLDKATYWWALSQYTFTENVEITSFNTDGNWNTWLYVKDKADPYTITISNKSGITLLVEGKYLTKDITILLDKSLFGEESGGGSGGTNSWSVESVTGASYGFALNSSGYYESGNKGKKSSSAVCKVVLDIKSYCKMYVDCINYAESNYDYGLLSKLDTTFTTSATADTSNVFKSFKGQQSSNVVAVDYGTLSVGSHSFYVKFVKDSSQDSNYDTLQFKVRLE